MKMMLQVFRRTIRPIILIVALGVGAVTAQAETTALTGLQTNEGYIKTLNKNALADTAKPLDVFRALFAALPQRVTVYPTENYYYFSFHRNGSRYAGNIRLAIDGLAKREIYFTYFRSATLQHPDGDGQRLVLNAGVGVEIERITDLSWKIVAFGKSVVFNLNDLSHVRPPQRLLREHETFIGPVFDESGLRFFLVFDKAKKEFAYVLDETVRVPEEFLSSAAHTGFRLGRRTGFLFAMDRTQQPRKVLAGVFAANVELNNYFDGPFDQLPDNFIKDDRLRNALTLQQPDLRGRIDRYGNLAGGETRAVIAPYATYESPEDLQVLAMCLKRSGLPLTEDCLQTTRGQAANN
ncbi:MAG: hypothetical protein AAGD43_33365 [Pseudomonadota bacterium]